MENQNVFFFVTLTLSVPRLLTYKIQMTIKYIVIKILMIFILTT